MLSLITGPDSCEQKTPVIKAWRDIFIDSAAVGGIAAFSVWAGTSGTLDMLAAIKAFGLSFFIQIVYYRGIKKL